MIDTFNPNDQYERCRIVLVSKSDLETDPDRRVKNSDWQIMARRAWNISRLFFDQNFYCRKKFVDIV